MSRIPLAASKLSPVMARAILHRRALPSRRLMSSAPPSRPFKIHVGVSFAGKPAEFRTVLQKRRNPIPDFPEGNDIARWRAEMLAWPKAVRSREAGEDFFYVQEVRIRSDILMTCSLTKYSTDAKPICGRFF